MTQIAYVSMSQAAKSGRLDPGFHIAAKRLEAQVTTLEQSISAEQAQAAGVALASAMDPQQLRQVLNPVRRGEGDRSVDDKELSRLTKDYPHLVLALLVEGASQARSALDAKIEAIAAKQTTLDEVCSEISRKVEGLAAPRASGPKAR